MGAFVSCTLKKTVAENGFIPASIERLKMFVRESWEIVSLINLTHKENGLKTFAGLASALLGSLIVLLMISPLSLPLLPSSYSGSSQCYLCAHLNVANVMRLCFLSRDKVC